MTDPVSADDGDRIRGMAEGYPTCCIDYYCQLAADGYAPAEEDSRRIGVSVLGLWLAEGGESAPQYVRCPECRGNYKR